MHIHDASKQYKNKFSECLLLQEAYRDEEGTPRHRTIVNLSKLPQNLKETIIKQVEGGRMVSLDEITQEDNRSLGEVTVFKRLADKGGIVKTLKRYLGKHIAALVLAMSINRVSEPKSRYSLRSWLKHTYLPEILKTPLADFHHNRLYEALEELEEKQKQIEEDLWEETKKKEEDLHLMLYDITSTYLEGEQNELAAYGYSRDKRKDRKQLVVALVATPKGRPVAVEVLPGNTTDKTTLLEKIEELKERFKIKEIVYVFDRGMHDEEKREELREEKIKYLTALSRSEIKKLESADKIQLGIFDKKIAEYKDEEVRYLVCKSDVATRNQKVTQALLAKTEEKMEMIKRNVEKGNWKKVKVIAARAERWLLKWKMKKYFQVEIEEGYFAYRIRKDRVEKRKQLDQLYVLETTDTQLSAEDVQQGYKNLAEIEQNFQILKSELELRPVNHRKEETTKGHVFVCFLALYLKKEFKLQVSELLEENTFDSLLKELREIRQSKLKAGKHQTYVVNKLNSLQKKILTSLHMRVLPIRK